MDRNALRRILLDLLENVTGTKVARFDEQLRFREDLHMDSVDLLSLVVDLEERLATSLSVTELEHVERIGQLLDVLQRTQNMTSTAA